MISKTTHQFWACFHRLPRYVQILATQKFRLWQENAFHPSLHFKPLEEGVWSVRINREFRALCRRRGELVVWFWIGTHADYDQFLKRT